MNQISTPLLQMKKKVYIQLFRQRLSHKSENIKAYATTPIGIMGGKLKVIQQQGRRKHDYKCFCCFVPLRWNTLRLTQWTEKTTISHNKYFSILSRELLTECKTVLLETAVYILRTQYLIKCRQKKTETKKQLYEHFHVIFFQNFPLF